MALWMVAGLALAAGRKASRAWLTTAVRGIEKLLQIKWLPVFDGGTLDNQRHDRDCFRRRVRRAQVDLSFSVDSAPVTGILTRSISIANCEFLN